MAHRPSGLPPGSSPRALLDQGVAAHRAGRLLEAEKLYEAVIRQNRRIADAHHLLAAVLGQQGRHEDGIRAAKRALKIDDRRAAFHATLGNLQLEARQAGRARQAFERAIALEPENSQVLAALGALLLRTGRAEDAIEALDRAVRIDPTLIAAWANLAAAHREVGDGERAVACYRSALERAPGATQLLVNLAQTFRELGRRDEAEAALVQALEREPELTSARLMLVQIRRNTARDAHTAWIEELLKDPGARGVTEHDAWFAQAKVLEDLGEDDAAFDALLAANTARRKTMTRSFDDDVALLRRIRETFTPELVAALKGQGCPDPTPIFVLGMPRSGTTLIEQILASHPEVFGAGEATHAAAVLGSELFAGEFPESMKTASAAALCSAGERYVALLRKNAPDAGRIVDKMPLNFVRLGAIHAMLPNAKVIHCVRDARDTCVSVFRQNFEFEMGWASDLAELGRFHRLYVEMMEHWRAVLGPDAFLDVRYEEVVTDLEPNARRILEYVGLSWDPGCLEFHRAARVVRTASLEQVRRPVYSSSVGAWRKWERQLTPLLDALK